MTHGVDNDEFDEMIAAALQAEIPAPSSDYWSRIDRSLADAAVRGTANLEDHDHLRFVDTDGDVLRLTSMNSLPRSSTRWTSTRFLVTAAAVVAVIALAGAAVFAEFSDSPTGVDSTSEAADNTSTSREPVSSEPAPVEPADIVVGSFEPSAVTDAGLEGVGCWFYRSGNESDLIFHGGYEAAMMVIDGRQIIGDTTGFWSVEDTVKTSEYEIRFTDVGAPVADSIESQRQPATLVVTPTDATRAPIPIPGELWCGV